MFELEACVEVEAWSTFFFQLAYLILAIYSTFWAIEANLASNKEHVFLFVNL